MIASFEKRTRKSLFFLLVVAAIGAAGLTDAQVIEHQLMRHADPATLPVIEKLDQKVSFDLTNATFTELLTAVSNTAGVTVLQSPDLAANAVQQAHFTLHAENMPVHAVLQEVLMPFQLVPELGPNGVTIAKGVVRMKHPEESLARIADGGQPVEHTVVIHKSASDDAQRGTTSGTQQKKITIGVSGSGGSCTFGEDGKLRGEFNVKMDEAGTTTAGKLTFEISKN